MNHDTTQLNLLYPAEIRSKMSSYDPNRTAVSLQSLPTELHLLIGTYLDWYTLARLFRTDHYFYTLFFSCVYHDSYPQHKALVFTSKQMRPGFKCHTHGHALLHAAQGGHTMLVTRLLSIGASVNTTCERCSTPLHLAVRHGHLKLAHSLIMEWKADTGIRCIVKGATEAKMTALELLVDLLSNELDFSPGPEPPKPQGADVEAIVPLFRLLFEAVESTKVSGRSGHGLIARIAGIQSCSLPAEVKVPIIAMVLERGAPVELPDSDDEAPNTELSKYDSPPDKCWEDEWYSGLREYQGLSLHEAVKGGHLAVVEQLLRAGADINRRNIWGGTALHFVDQRIRCCDICGAGKDEMLEFLLRKGADVWARDKDGVDALAVSVRRGSMDLAEALQKRMLVVPPVQFFEDGKIPI